MPDQDNDSIAVLGKASGILIEFAVGILVFMALGWLGDSWLGTDPWMVIVGVAFGFGGGLYRMIRQLKALSESDTSSRDRESGEPHS